MSFKAVLKTLCFLALLFVMLYVGMNNPDPINFNFPIAGSTAKSPIRASAALIFFGVFAIGVFAGMALHRSNDGGAKKKAGRN